MEIPSAWLVSLYCILGSEFTKLPLLRAYISGSSWNKVWILCFSFSNPCNSYMRSTSLILILCFPLPSHRRVLYLPFILLMTCATVIILLLKASNTDLSSVIKIWTSLAQSLFHTCLLGSIMWSFSSAMVDSLRLFLSSLQSSCCNLMRIL